MSEGVRRFCDVTPKKTWPITKHTRFDKTSNEYWRVVKWVKSLGKTPMTGFYTWHWKCKGVGRDLGCEHEESHIMHDT